MKITEQNKGGGEGGREGGGDVWGSVYLCYCACVILLLSTLLNGGDMVMIVGSGSIN